MRNKDIRNIVFAALFAAIASILKMYALHFGDFRISLFAIPLLLAGYYLGPWYGLAVGFITDTVYILMSPFGSIWSIYTISTMIWGVSGYILRIAKLNWWKFALIILLTSLLETSINSIAMLVEGGNDWIYVASGLPRRLIILVLRFPILVLATREIIVRFKQIQLDFNWNEWIHFQ